MTYNLFNTIKNIIITPVYADPNQWQDPSMTNPGPAVFEDLEYVVDKGLQALFALGGLTAFAYILIGGFQYLTAGGDEKAILAAKQTLMWAIIGLVVVISAWLILTTLGGMFDIPELELLEFTIPKTP